MTRFGMAQPVGLVGLALALLAATPLAAQRPASFEAAPPLFELYPTVGLSVHQTPLTTSFADVIPFALRVGVPVGRLGLEPWAGAAVSHVKLGCSQSQPACSATEKRFLLGAAYRPGGLGGAYVGLGLGVRNFRGADGFAHSIILGFAFPATRYIAPGFELRSEGYQGFGELLVMAAVVRLSWPR